MELIPILATIILVATISTFFLSIGAYVLYKIREAQGVRKKASVPQSIQAELVVPEHAAEQTAAQTFASESARRTVSPYETTRVPTYRPTQVTNTAPVQTRRPAPEQRPAPSSYAPVRAEPPQQPSAAPQQPKKFVRVTSETAEQPVRERQQGGGGSGGLKWR